MKNILVVSVNWLGDVVFSTPVYYALKAFYPGARLTALCVPGVADVFRLCPAVDDIIVFDEKGKDRFVWRRFVLTLNLRKKNFDAVFFLKSSFSRILLAWLAGIPVRAGFRPRGAPLLLTHPANPAETRGVHRRDVYLSVIESFGVPVHDRTCRLFVSDAARLNARQFLSERGVQPGDPYIVLNTGGNWDLKQWPPDRFSALARRIHRELKIRIILPGSLRDRLRTQEIADSSGCETLVLAGSTDLLLLAAILAGAAAVISADSGPLHLASALGVDVIGVFGPTRPEITGPCGSGRKVILQKDAGCNRAPCYYLECPDNVCMQQVTIDDVFQAVQQIQS